MTTSTSTSLHADAPGVFDGGSANFSPVHRQVTVIELDLVLELAVNRVVLEQVRQVRQLSKSLTATTSTCAAFESCAEGHSADSSEPVDCDFDHALEIAASKHSRKDNNLGLGQLAHTASHALRGPTRVVSGLSEHRRPRHRWPVGGVGAHQRRARSSGVPARAGRSSRSFADHRTRPGIQPSSSSAQNTESVARHRHRCRRLTPSPPSRGGGSAGVVVAPPPPAHSTGDVHLHGSVCLG